MESQRSTGVSRVSGRIRPNEPLVSLRTSLIPCTHGLVHGSGITPGTLPVETRESPNSRVSNPLGGGGETAFVARARQSVLEPKWLRRPKPPQPLWRAHTRGEDKQRSACPAKGTPEGVLLMPCSILGKGDWTQECGSARLQPWDKRPVCPMICIRRGVMNQARVSVGSLPPKTAASAICVRNGCRRYTLPIPYLESAE